MNNKAGKLGIMTKKVIEQDGQTANYVHKVSQL